MTGTDRKDRYVCSNPGCLRPCDIRYVSRSRYFGADAPKRVLRLEGHRGGGGTRLGGVDGLTLRRGVGV